MVGKCYIDGVDIYTTYGVVLEKSEGTLAPLQLKDPVTHSWPDEHGDDVYLDKVYLQPREITLKCAIVATSASGYVTALKNFFNALVAPKYRYLKLANINKGYLVYLKEATDVTRITRMTGNPVIGRFTIRLYEPHPVNRTFSCTSATCSLTISSQKSLTIWWGDGTSDTIQGTSQNKSKNYGSAATRYVVLFGSVEAITSISSSNLSEITN
jgi:hypothetical protein